VRGALDRNPREAWEAEFQALPLARDARALLKLEAAESEFRVDFPDRDQAIRGGAKLIQRYRELSRQAGKTLWSDPRLAEGARAALRRSRENLKGTFERGGVPEVAREIEKWRD
jgi:hypothetical protein